LLYEKKNNNGDTPLHCAARAGKCHLVSYLIGLAKDNDKVQDLLRVMNNSNETALHKAIRRGDKEMVKELLRADPELTFFPPNGTSPLYLTIQLIDDTAILQEEEKQAGEEGRDAHLKKNKEEKSMAQILHDESKDGFLSYSGPNGQNALHAAVLRVSAGTHKKHASFLDSINIYYAFKY
jgi:ankyrin repeat protein